MIKRQSKGIVIVFVIFALLCAVNFLVLSASESGAPGFSTYNNEGDGVALLYDTFAGMGYKVDRGFEFVTPELDTRQTQLFIQPSTWFDYHEHEEIMSWVESGGRLVVLEAGGYTQFDYLFDGFYFADVANEYYYGYYYGLGMIVTGDSELITNAALMNNPSPGAALANILGQSGRGRIVFNEAIHGYINKNSTWQNVPYPLKAVIFQTAILSFYIVWHYGRRFGKPIPYHEEIEREENEHAKALANLYHSSRSYEVAANEGLDQFIKRVSLMFHASEKFTRDNLSMLWKNAGLRHQNWIDDLPVKSGKTTRRKMRLTLRRLKTLTKILYQKGEPDVVHAIGH